MDDDDDSDSSNINGAAAVEITNDDSMYTISSKDTIKRRMKISKKQEDDTENQHDPGSYGNGFTNQSGLFNLLPNYNNPNMPYPTFLKMSQPKTSSPINNKRKRDLEGTSYMDDEISNRIAPILNGLYNSHADLSSFLNTHHDNNDHKLAQHARGTRKQGDNRRKRGNCRQCPNTVDGKRNARQTSYYCETCQVSLHPDCFHSFHSKKLQQPDHETVESTKINNDSIATTNDSIATTNDLVATTCNNLLPVH